MDFTHGERSQQLQAEVARFLDELVYPAEPEFRRQEQANRASGQPFATPALARTLYERGRWAAKAAKMAGGIEHIVDQCPITFLKRHIKPICRAKWPPCDKDCESPSPPRGRRSCQTIEQAPHANPRGPACSMARPDGR